MNDFGLVLWEDDSVSLSTPVGLHIDMSTIDEFLLQVALEAPKELLKLRAVHTLNRFFSSEDRFDSSALARLSSEELGELR